jgi:hypothetical protein
MASKKSSKPSSRTNAHVKPKAKPQAQPTRLQNLAARPVSFDTDTLDEAMLADNSGVFRVTSALQQAQVGHEDNRPRFANDSMAMHAHRDAAGDDATLDEAVTDHSIQRETAQADKQGRLATLASRAKTRQQRR